MAKTARRMLWLALVAAAVAGCRKTVVYNDVVEGMVKLDGVPLAGVHVQFVPEGESDLKMPGSNGLTDESGHYHLDCDDGKSGAVVGKHVAVVLVGRDPDPGADGDNPEAGPPPGKAKKRRPQVPACYTLPLDTPLLLQVTPDRHTYDLELSSRAQPRR
jgi:hypothetical protein